MRKSLVLLKNDGILPLKPSANILVAGDAADDIARQSGGWTLTWQGTGLTNANFPGATSLWKGIEGAVKEGGGRAELAPDGRFKQRPDAAIVIFGETPYAEFQGDLRSLQLKPELRGSLETMRRLRAAGIPVVAVMITGRPLFVNAELNAANAFVTAWLPGSEGGGVADLLFGGGAADFQGRLPTAWPADARHGGLTLFPFGYGLSLKEGGQRWKKLSEAAGVDDRELSNTYFARGEPAASWSLIVDNAAGNEGLRVTAVPSDAVGGRVRVTAVDHEVQEGARQFAITGGAAGTTIALATHAPVDVSRETNSDAMLLATVRLDTAPTAPVSFSASCGSGCLGTIALPELATLAPGRWTTLGIPLKCLARAGADMTRLDAPFRLSTQGNATFSLSRVALGTVADKVISCAR